MSTYEYLSLILLFLTGVVITIYTVETYRLRITSVNQLKLSIMPSIVVDQIPNETSFSIQNVGNGVAVNIRFDDTVLSSDFGIALRFPKMLCLLPFKSELITIEPIRNGRKVDFPFQANFDERYATNQHVIMVTFEDISQNKYRQEIQLGKDGPYVGKIVCIDVEPVNIGVNVF